MRKSFYIPRIVSDAETFYEYNDQMNFNATLNLFANMGENIGKISNELKLVYTDISWSEIKGFRNRVVHDYINIDTFMVFDIIKNDLLKLKRKLMEVVALELSKGNLDKEEYEVAKRSFYYRHINFEYSEG
ncbi:HepT-like ribonuclease domain-containing protein [Desulfosporosinus metallidurans]|uniref:DUF86 domain-containing protein n=1 Tax=Desulfosporosinus metallidurans TaxID=1888891 RepID=A0A1Q8QJB8_9FIRM|nr:HepT-like ribonuclease domain-containing protein [Desulfosporosinus metallidurans]OLN27447.1 hypothetical protein DSOL_4524 [Desulfosporosinus metallidurans]